MAGPIRQTVPGESFSLPTRGKVNLKIDTVIRHATKPDANRFLELGFPREETERLYLASEKQIIETKQLKERFISEVARH